MKIKLFSQLNFYRFLIVIVCSVLLIACAEQQEKINSTGIQPPLIKHDGRAISVTFKDSGEFKSQ